MYRVLSEQIFRSNSIEAVIAHSRLRFAISRVFANDDDLFFLDSVAVKSSRQTRQLLQCRSVILVQKSRRHDASRAATS